MSDPLVSIDKGVTDPIVVWMAAHGAVLRVAPRAHEKAVLAVARALLKRGMVAQSEVRALVIENDPIARALQRGMNTRAKRPSSKRAASKRAARLN